MLSTCSHFGGRAQRYPSPCRKPGFTKRRGGSAVKSHAPPTPRTRHVALGSWFPSPASSGVSQEASSIKHTLLFPQPSANRGQFNTLLQLVFLVFKHKFNKHLLSASCGDPGSEHEALSEAGDTETGLPAHRHVMRQRLRYSSVGGCRPQRWENFSFFPKIC